MKNNLFHPEEGPSSFRTSVTSEVCLWTIPRNTRCRTLSTFTCERNVPFSYERSEESLSIWNGQGARGVEGRPRFCVTALPGSRFFTAAHDNATRMARHATATLKSYKLIYNFGFDFRRIRVYVEYQQRASSSQREREKGIRLNKH